MGQFGRITGVADLPREAALAKLIRSAMKLNEDGVKPKKAPRKPAKPLAVPDDLSAALAKNKKAQAQFNSFSPSCRNEYVQWITEAKRDETRQKRLATAIQWMAEGKSRNWKYER
jgi:uncharacterized protein YdeI (YjbR/CyaY-like superfamily)